MFHLKSGWYIILNLIRYCQSTQSVKVKNQRYYPAVEGDDIRSIRFRPELTSIRAPMALLVIAAHNDQSWRRGFWIGLNTWMAISGFVITLSLLTEYDRVGKISIKNFYIRRALRLLPALYVASIAVLLFGWITHQGDYLLQYVYSTLAAIFYYEDIFVVATYGHGFAVFAQLWTIWGIEGRTAGNGSRNGGYICYNKNEVYRNGNPKFNFVALICVEPCPRTQKNCQYIAWY